MNRLGRKVLILAMLLLAAGLLWERARRNHACAPPWTGAEESTRRVSVADSFRKSRTTAVDPLGSELPAETPSKNPPTTVAEGFFITKEDRLILVDFSAYGHSGGFAWVNIFPDTSIEIDRKSAPTLRSERSAPFEDFLNGRVGPDAIPPARFRVRLQSGDTNDKPRIINQVLEEEILGDRWLLAWRDFYQASCDAQASGIEAPGMEKRNKLLDAATRFADALSRARTARAGDACTRWRVREESHQYEIVAERLARFNLCSAIPGLPTSGDIQDLFDEAAAPGDLRSTIFGKWGADAMALEFFFSRLVDQGNEERGPTWSAKSMDIDEVCAMSQDSFDALKGQIREMQDAVFSDDGGQELPTAALHSRLDALGLQVEPITAADRERLFVEYGVRVTAVVPGSAADAGGAQVGDVLRSAQLEKEGGARGLDCADAFEAEIRNNLSGSSFVTLKAVRDGQNLTLVISVSR